MNHQLRYAMPVCLDHHAPSSFLSRVEGLDVVVEVMLFVTCVVFDVVGVFVGGLLNIVCGLASGILLQCGRAPIPSWAASGLASVTMCRYLC